MHVVVSVACFKRTWILLLVDKSAQWWTEKSELRKWKYQKKKINLNYIVWDSYSFEHEYRLIRYDNNINVEKNT